MPHGGDFTDYLHLFPCKNQIKNYPVIIHIYPANIQRRNKVALKSPRPHGVAETSERRRYDVVCLLGKP